MSAQIADLPLHAPASLCLRQGRPQERGGKCPPWKLRCQKLFMFISRNLIPDSIFISSVTFSAHFLYGPLQQIKKQLTVTLKFRNERLSKYYRQNTNVTI